MHEAVTPRTRARWSLVLATAAHAAVLLAASRVTRTPPVLPPGPPVTEAEVEVAVEAPPLPEVVAPAPEAQSVVPPIHEVARVLRAGSSSEATLPAEAPSPVASAEPSAGGWTFSPTVARPSASAHMEGDAGVTFAQATTAGVGAVVSDFEKREERRRTSTIVQEERELGLVAGGRYVTLTRDRVRNSITAINGHAVMEFWTDAKGVVARVRVVDASSDRGAWDEVAAGLAQDARSAPPLKVPIDAAGLVITLDVTSALKTLSGATPSSNPLTRILGAINDPVDAIVDSKSPPQRVVAARVVDVRSF